MFIPPMLVLPTATSEPEGCKIIHSITVCVDDIKRSDVDTQVKLKISGDTNLVDVNIFADDENGLPFALLDEQGRSYSLTDHDGIVGYDETEHAYYYRLFFQPVPADVKKLTVSLPIVQISSKSKTEAFQIDIGENPQPG